MRCPRHARIAVATVVFAIAGCAGPTHGRGDYEHKLANTAEALESSAQTVLLVARVVEHDKAWDSYAASVVSESEDDATNIQGTFDSRQPPDARSDELRQHADDVIEKVVSAITDARVGIRAGDRQALLDAASDLRDLMPSLQRLEEVAS